MTDAHESHVVAGLKSTLKRDDVSPEAKAHAKKVLMEEHGIHVVEEGDSHHIGGLKAAIHNPNTSEEAKEHAKKVLMDDYNVDWNDTEHHDKDPVRVAAGLKAAMENSHNSAAAKEGAAERLEAME